MASITVAKLRSRIEEISSAVDRQKAVLRDLENQRSAIQEELNSILDPISRLPLEISSHILTCCLLQHAQRPSPRDAPLLFLNICRSWSAIALATPALWTGIHIGPPFSDDFGKLIDRWLARARARPLSFTLRGPRMLPVVYALVDQYVDRLQTLELYLPSAHYLTKMAESRTFTALRTLTIGQGEYDDSDQWEPFSVNAVECVEMLSAAPNLVACTLDNIYFAEDLLPAIASGLQTGGVTHSRLRHLRLASKFDCSCAIILQALTLPSLEHLTISAGPIMLTFDDLFAFLTRSSPPLHSLCLESVPHLSPDLDLDSRVQTFLQLVPAVVDLDLFFGTGNNFGVAVAAALEILDAITARRASPTSCLSSFRLSWASTFDAAARGDLSADIITTVRELVAGGMQIHIGPERRNLIAVSSSDAAGRS
ncbi:hypothetical protein B0H11DRAFT_2065325 [Mycena galericulata]|nr:hypothetical protein B0H11DRAFT_2065325 [Mycena galericulata]